MADKKIIAVTGPLAPATVPLEGGLLPRASKMVDRSLNRLWSPSRLASRHGAGSWAFRRFETGFAEWPPPQPAHVRVESTSQGKAVNVWFSFAVLGMARGHPFDSPGPLSFFGSGERARLISAHLLETAANRGERHFNPPTAEIHR